MNVQQTANRTITRKGFGSMMRKNTHIVHAGQGTNIDHRPITPPSLFWTLATHLPNLILTYFFREEGFFFYEDDNIRIARSRNSWGSFCLVDYVVSRIKVVAGCRSGRVGMQHSKRDHKTPVSELTKRCDGDDEEGGPSWARKQQTAGKSCDDVTTSAPS